MSKKSVYLIQANYKYSGSAHLPYAVGMLQAFAESDEKIKEKYRFEKLIFERKPPEILAEEIKNPSVVGFSCYVWNYEYNKAAAKLIKAKYPDCTVVFGGHHVVSGSEQLERHSYIDVLIHGEGEEAFAELLLALSGFGKIENISNISYRTKDGIFNNKTAPITRSEYPSPYLEGCFDSILHDNPEIDFLALIETNRGCPYSCAYCDWGCLSSKLRLFDMERVKKEIDWFARNRIDMLGATDANFGIIERDEDIAELLAESKRNTGFPKKFQTSYAKNSSDRVFRIGKLFEQNGMSKGVTVSYQTMSDVAAENVMRKNIPMDVFSDLMDKYNAEGIPTYTELILGLPGETVASLKEGINRLLEAGQHYSLYIHNCEFLPCSALAEKKYAEKYEISATKIPLNEPHREPETGGIREYSRIVTSTYSMTREDWVEMNIFSYLVQGFHHLGLLKYAAIYMYNSRGMRYDDFYSAVLAYFKESDSEAGRAIGFIEERLKAVLRGEASLTAFDSRFGTVDWPFEELLFLRTVYERDEFYNDVRRLLRSMGIDGELADELAEFQKSIIKYPGSVHKRVEFKYDFVSFFNGSELKKENTAVIIDGEAPKEWDEYARKTVWFGRKSESRFFDYKKE